MDPASEAPAIVEFGRFTVLPHRRELLADGQSMELGGRAFDVLMVLIAARGELVGKDEILSRVWPGAVVEENNLQVQISALRKALGEDRDVIKTISGRGYRFVAKITIAGAPAAVSDSGAALAAAFPDPAAPTNLPAAVTDLIGRDADLFDVTNLVTAHRLVTLTGAGGIGKTRLGLEVARHLLPEFPDGVWVAELAPLSDPDLVPVTVATALGLKLDAGAVSPERVAEALGAKRFLLMLDNCEHVIDAAARMAEALLRADSAPHVMATSREKLGAEGECVYRVPPLDVPAQNTEDPAELLRHGALRLFVARARAADPHFSPDRRNAAAMAAICRRLDGLPLAIEFAAARAAALGVEELAARLDDRFRLLTGGRRTALPRHQTLRATLDWSYELLPEPERLVLRRLSVFATGFALEAARAVAASAEIAASEVDDAMANLVAKSLVTADVGGVMVRYRLLETTRAYALEKLAGSGEAQPVARRHAEFYRDLFKRAEAEWETRPTAEWLAEYGWRLDNVRAALDWAFGPSGDASIGVALTIASVPLWAQLSLMEECRGRVEIALALSAAASSRSKRHEMQLNAALGWSLMYTAVPVRETGAAWAAALDLARSLDDPDYQLRSLWGLWAGRMNNGEFGNAHRLARAFHRLAEKTADPANQLIGDRMIGASLHFLGDQAGARRHIEHMLAHYIAPAYGAPVVRFQFDQRVTASITLARILWLQGFVDQSLRTVESNIVHALSIGHHLSLCNALAQAACPIALLVGDLAAAERYIALLVENAATRGVDIWHIYCRAFQGQVLIYRGDFDNGLPRLGTAIDELRQAKFVQYQTAFLATLAEGMCVAGQATRGLEVIDGAMARSERDEERWCVAELLRIKGALVLLEGAPQAEGAAEDHFRQALDGARRQGALSWELRAATSLARLWHGQDRTKEARELLVPVYDRFTEGFETADLKAAKALIDNLQPCASAATSS
jgi:predicted ATPase/DNA-binding winged helix-turn-helix (wHTH) protein